VHGSQAPYALKYGPHRKNLGATAKKYFVTNIECLLGIYIYMDITLDAVLYIV
jgi:hypothetical protein